MASWKSVPLERGTMAKTASSVVEAREDPAVHVRLPLLDPSDSLAALIAVLQPLRRRAGLVGSVEMMKIGRGERQYAQLVERH